MRASGVGGAEDVSSAGAAVGRREGQPGGVARIIARRAQWRGRVRVMCVRPLVPRYLIKLPRRPPHVVCEKACIVVKLLPILQELSHLCLQLLHLCKACILVKLLSIGQELSQLFAFYMEYFSPVVVISVNKMKLKRLVLARELPTAAHGTK